MDIEYLDETFFDDDLWFPDEQPTPAPVTNRVRHVEDTSVPCMDDRRRYVRACTCGATYLSRDVYAVGRELGRHLAEARKASVMAVQCP